MSESKKKTDGSRNRYDSDVSGQYNTMVQSLLDIWNVLAASSVPLTAGQVGERMKKKRTSAQTAERRLNDSVDLINAVFPHTVLREEGQSAILHTYPHKGALHVVMEQPTGEPFWEGEMTAVFHDSALNPIPQSTLNRKIPELAADYDDMKLAVKKNRKAAAKAASESGDEPPREQQDTLFQEDYPPLSLAGVVATKTKSGKSVYIPCTAYENRMKKLPRDKQPKKSPARRFYLESILTPEEWQLLSDVILVYPYISEMETDKLLSAMSRMAPGSRKWNKLVQAKKTPNAVRFDFIRQLEEAIQSGHKVSLEYGRYHLAHQLGGWKPVLQADGHGMYVTHPYALTWSNGYYYLVCSVETKGPQGETLQEMRNFRLDRIRRILPTTVPFTRPDDFNVHRYRDRSPVMYPGEAVPIRLRCHISMLSVLMDFFGTAISDFGEPQNDHTTVTLEASEQGTKLFAMQYAQRVEVLEPRSLREDVAEALQAAADRYR